MCRYVGVARSKHKLSNVDWIRVKEVYQKCLRMSPFERRSFLESLAKDSPAVAAEADFLLKESSTGGSTTAPLVTHGLGGGVPPAPRPNPDLQPPPASGNFPNPGRGVVLDAPSAAPRIALQNEVPEESGGSYLKIILVAFLIGVFVGGALLLYPRWKAQQERAAIADPAFPIGIEDADVVPPQE